MAMNFDIVHKLEEELEKLNHELLIELPYELRIAAERGDLSENAEYDAAKERKRFVESRISILQKRVSEIKSINVNAIPQDKVGLGSWVKLEDLDTEKIEEFTFVFSEEADPDKGKISLGTPIGKALVGRQVGDEVIVRTPKGKREFEIIELSTIHDQKSNG